MSERKNMKSKYKKLKEEEEEERSIRGRRRGIKKNKIGRAWIKEVKEGESVK